MNSEASSQGSSLVQAFLVLLVFTLTLITLIIFPRSNSLENTTPSLLWQSEWEKSCLKLNQRMDTLQKRLSFLETRIASPQEFVAVLNTNLEQSSGTILDQLTQSQREIQRTQDNIQNLSEDLQNLEKAFKKLSLDKAEEN